MERGIYKEGLKERGRGCVYERKRSDRESKREGERDRATYKGWINQYPNAASRTLKPHPDCVIFRRAYHILLIIFHTQNCFCVTF